MHEAIQIGAQASAHMEERGQYKYGSKIWQGVRFVTVPQMTKHFLQTSYLHHRFDQIIGDLVIRL
jgi:hypothetical protein